MGFNWKKLKDAKVFGKGNYLEPGNYKLRVLKMFTKETRSNGDALIVDLEVLESDNDKIPVGQKRNWYQGLRDQDIAFPAIKEFLIALFDVDESDEKELGEFEESLGDLMEECSDEKWEKKKDEEHPLNGKTIAVECFMKRTKGDKDFTVHKWSAWDEDE